MKFGIWMAIGWRSAAKLAADMHGLSVKVNVFRAPVETTVASCPLWLCRVPAPLEMPSP